MSDIEKPWRLVIGIHSGTMMSRDSGETKCKDLEACKAEFETSMAGYRSMGLKLWFVTAYGPNGEQEKLAEGEPYR